MTNLLLRLFIKNYRNTSDPKVRGAVGILSGIVGIVCNLLLFAGKLLVGTLAGSVSITADAVNNLSDASSALITLIGFKLAERPADQGHPYGHARMEYLAGLAVAALILIIGVGLGRSSVDKILHPVPVSFSQVTFLVLAVSIALKLWMSLFNRNLGRRIDSGTLLAVSADSRNDVLSTAAVLLAGLAEHHFGVQIDGYMGLAVALFILWSGISIARDTINPLLGQETSPELIACITGELKKHDKILGYHDLMVHDYGPGQRFATVHVEMDAREDPLACHDIIDNVERACMQYHQIHLCIHYDPIVTDDAQLNHLRERIIGRLHQIDTRLSIHDFRMVRGPMHTNLIFDLLLPYDMAKQRAALREAIEQTLLQEPGRYYTIITFEESSCQAEH